MIAKEAKRLRVGDRVRWELDDTHDGAVSEVGYNAVKIQWDDGTVTIAPHNWDSWEYVHRAGQKATA